MRVPSRQPTRSDQARDPGLSFGRAVKALVTGGLLAGAGAWGRPLDPTPSQGAWTLPALDLPQPPSVLPSVPAHAGRGLQQAEAPRAPDSAGAYDDFCAVLTGWSAWQPFSANLFGNGTYPGCLHSAALPGEAWSAETSSSSRSARQWTALRCQAKDLRNDTLLVDGRFNRTDLSSEQTPGLGMTLQAVQGTVTFSGALNKTCDLSHGRVTAPLTDGFMPTEDTLGGSVGTFCGLDVGSLALTLPSNGSSPLESLAVRTCLER